MGRACETSSLQTTPVLFKYLSPVNRSHALSIYNFENNTSPPQVSANIRQRAWCIIRQLIEGVPVQPEGLSVAIEPWGSLLICRHCNSDKSFQRNFSTLPLRTHESRSCAENRQRTFQSWRQAVACYPVARLAPWAGILNTFGVKFRLGLILRCCDKFKSVMAKFVPASCLSYFKPLMNDPLILTDRHLATEATTPYAGQQITVS